MFFITSDDWKTLLFIYVYLFSEVILTAIWCFLWNQCFEKSQYFMRYLHKNNAMLTLLYIVLFKFS